MRIKQIVLVIIISLISMGCVLFMNRSYDRLARYQYDNPEARSLIAKYMSDDEIEYIIEYAIDPDTFIRYIKAPSFSVYRTDYYDYASQYLYFADDENIVEFSEKIASLSKNPKEDLKYLVYYSYDELIYYLEHGDEYTISIHEPKNLVSLNENIKVKDVLLEAYEGLLSDINDKYHIKNGGNMKPVRGYLSYKELVNMRRGDPSIRPGHDFAQTGLEIQLDLTNSVFKNDSRTAELKALLCQRGFILESLENNLLTVRYNIDYSCKVN